MQNNNRKVFETFISRTKIYLAIILVLLIIMCVENNKLIIPSSIIVYLAIVDILIMQIEREKVKYQRH